MAQIATIKVQTASGVKAIPVFQPGDINGNKVRDILHVSTPSGTGVIPLTDTGDATYGFLRVQTQNNGVLAFHDNNGVLIDDFEDGNISEYSQNTGSFSATTGSPVKYGSYSLKCGTNNERIISSTLNYIPSAGDTIEWWGRGDNSYSGLGVIFGYQDTNNYYQSDMRVHSNTLKFGVNNGGSFTWLISKTVSMSQSTWYRQVIEWGSGGNFTITIYDASGSAVGSGTATDTAHTSGSFGFTSAPSNGTPSLTWDRVRVI